MTESSIRVLIVDDDYHVAGIHAAYVERVVGFVVIGQAHTAVQAQEMAIRLRPDLVLMDIFLPDGNGLDVVRTLLTEAPPPDVIVISAAREFDSVRSAMKLGALHHLVKPFRFQALEERLEAYQRLRHHLAHLEDLPDQADVDELYQLFRPDLGPVRPPKGQSAPTLELILEAVRGSTIDISAAEIAEQVGISRATAQRYLSHLERQGTVILQLRYGTAGRPEHRYRPGTSQPRG